MLSKNNQNWMLTMLKLSNAWKKKIKEFILGNIIIIIIFVAVVTLEEGEVTSEEGFFLE